MIGIQNLTKISDHEWEIPQSYRKDMRVPVRIFATQRLLEQVMDDKSLEQAVNAASLPGLVGRVVVMPDMHQGYGFPIGGVAATEFPQGVVSPGAIGYDINCLTGDALILHSHGYTRRISDLVREQSCAQLDCLNAEKECRDSTRPIRWLNQVQRATLLRVSTVKGHTVTATADHPFWTPDGMVALGRLKEDSEIAVSPFEGIAYEEPSDDVLVPEKAFANYLKTLGKGSVGSAIGQILAQLRNRSLLPLRYDSATIPYLCKIIGFVFGDGTVCFDQKTGKGIVAFYGQADDLEDIRRDLAALGFKPSRVWSRERRHNIQTTYSTYEFEHTERWCTVNSTAFAALLGFLGTPLGNKAKQDYDAPAWLDNAPLWQKRLFMAAFFGAEMATPKTVTGHGSNFGAPMVSVNKRQEYEKSGEQFLQHIAKWLNESGVATRPIGARPEQLNQDGSRSIRLRLVVEADADNLIRLWSTIGFDYNRSRRAMAAAAVQYLAAKQRHIHARQSIADQARSMATAGVTRGQIFEQLVGKEANTRFIERSLYEGRRTPPRTNVEFPTFEEFNQGLLIGESGFVWERVASIEQLENTETVYDFTVEHPDHNFVANGFVVSNCGVRLLASDIEYEAAIPHLDTLATLLNKYCPSGVGVEGVLRVNIPELERVLREGSRWALKNGYASEQDLARTEEGGCLEAANPAKVSERAKKRGQTQLGSLGAGNHFIEIDVVDEIFDEQAATVMGLRAGCLALQIHCGSRGLGHQVCTDYVQELQAAVKHYGIVLPDRELVCAPMDSPEGQAYLGAMRAAANFAFANRQILAHSARRAFEEIFASRMKGWELRQVYDLAHNMGKVETHEVDGERMKVCVHRKGATRAFGPGSPGLPPEYQSIGQPVLVPGSMGTASWVLVGTEESMQRSFGSSCHGAGRVMSRSKAKHEMRGEDLRRELEQGGIKVRAGSMSGLAEESPRAYKDVDEVVETVTAAGIARKVARMRPVVVIKG